MTKHRLPLDTPEEKARAKAWIDKAPKGWRVEFKPPVRSSVASAYMWALLDDVAEQKDWPLGSGRRWPSEGWKDLFSAAVRGQEMVPNLDNTGFVAFGSRTSEFSPEEMSDMIECILSWGTANGVQFTDQPQPAEAAV